MSHKPETLALHAGWRADPATGAVAVPIYQTTSYQFQSAEHAANLFALKELGNIYTRIGNPTTDVLEKRVAALEGGVAALALASGQAASAFAIQNLARVGRQRRLLDRPLRGHLEPVRQHDEGPGDRSALRRSGRSGEFPQSDRRPHARLLCRDAAEPEADRIPDRGSGGDRPVVRHSSGHGQHRRADPDPAVRSRRGDHRLFVDQIPRRPRHLDRRPPGRRRQFPLGGAQRAPAGAQHARSELSRSGVDRGGEAARADRLYHQGAHDTAARSRLMHVAVQRLPHPARNRDAAAAHRAPFAPTPRRSRPGSASGRRSPLSSIRRYQKGEAKRRAEKYLKGGQGGLVGFEIKGGKAAGAKFIDALKLLYHVANIGDARSLAIHPATTTHSQLTTEEQLATGVTDNYVRLSIGIEHIDDILADLDQALKAAA